MEFLLNKLVKTQEWIMTTQRRAIICVFAVLTALITTIFILVPSNKVATTKQLVALPQQTTAANNFTISSALQLDKISPASSAAIGTPNLQYTTFPIKGSIFASGEKSGVSRKTIYQFIRIFRDRINFRKDIHNGDEFALLRNSDSKIAAAEIILHHKAYRAIAFTDPKGHTAYYSPKGFNLKAPFVRFPLRFKRISSKFSLHRFHPILHIYCAHLGVDFAAKLGTPIKATSDGVIRFVGIKHNYGKVIILAHNQYSTLYAHLLRFAKKIKRGRRIKQGQVIAYLGDTGLSTGPHLHYEFRINGKHYDPLKVKLPRGEKIARTYRNKFFAQAKILITQLNAHHPSMYAMQKQN